MCQKWFGFFVFSFHQSKIKSAGLFFLCCRALNELNEIAADLHRIWFRWTSDIHLFYVCMQLRSNVGFKMISNNLATSIKDVFNGVQGKRKFYLTAGWTVTSVSSIYTYMCNIYIYTYCVYILCVCVLVPSSSPQSLPLQPPTNEMCFVRRLLRFQLMKYLCVCMCNARLLNWTAVVLRRVGAASLNDKVYWWLQRGCYLPPVSIRFAAAASIFTNDPLGRKIEVILPRRFRDKRPEIHLAGRQNIQCFLYAPLSRLLSDIRCLLIVRPQK